MGARIVWCAIYKNVYTIKAQHARFHCFANAHTRNASEMITIAWTTTTRDWFNFDLKFIYYVPCAQTFAYMHYIHTNYMCSSLCFVNRSDLQTARWNRHIQLCCSSFFPLRIIIFYYTYVRHSWNSNKLHAETLARLSLIKF